MKCAMASTSAAIDNQNDSRDARAVLALARNEKNSSPARAIVHASARPRSGAATAGAPTSVAVVGTVSSSAMSGARAVAAFVVVSARIVNEKLPDTLCPSADTVRQATRE